MSVERVALMPDGIDFPEAAGLVISAGTAAVQIARSIRARVVAVASARNHDYLRDLGAEVIIDYHDDAFVEEMRDAAPRRV